jgi:hypothetical protein
MTTITEQQLVTLMRIIHAAVQASRELDAARAALDDAAADRDATKFALSEALETLDLNVKTFFEVFGYFD